MNKPMRAISSPKKNSIFPRSFMVAPESLKLKTCCNQVKFLPPKREAFHKRGGFCSGRSEYQKRLTSSETLDGLRRRLARRITATRINDATDFLFFMFSVWLGSKGSCH